MSYFEKIQVYSADSPSIDAFGKWRVSNPTTLFDAKNVVDTGSSYSTTTFTGGTETWNSGSANITLTVTTTSGSRVVRQTKTVFPYQPGKSQQIICTGIFGSGVTGIQKRIGSFDDFDGLYFEQSGSSFGVVKRSTLEGVTNITFVSQSNWNIDKMDGTGPSGLSLDLTKAQIFTVDYEWLGVGRVRYGVVLKGICRYVHEFAHYNELNGVYIRNPNLPVRYEIVNYGSATGSSLKQICSTVISEGGFSAVGERVAIHDGGSSIDASQYGSTLRIRYHPSASQGVSITPEQIDFLVTPGNASKFSGRWDLLLNPTLPNASTWLNVSGSSNLQFSVDSTAVTITGSGKILATGYFGGTGGTNISDNIRLNPYFSLGRTYTNVSDVIVLAVKNIENTYTIYPTVVMNEIS